MSQKLNKEQIQELIDKIYALFKDKQVTESEQAVKLLTNVFSLYHELYKSDDRGAVRGVIQFFIPLLTYSLKNYTDTPESTRKIAQLYESSFAFAGRRSLEHFIDYMEWDRTSHNKVLANRRDVLKPFIYYLNKAKFDPKLKYVVASYPPSYAKTFTVNYYTAWGLGIDKNASFIRMSYNDELVNKMSRQVQGIINDKRFADVFPEYQHCATKVLNKTKSSDWNTKITDEATNFIARTRDAGITGNRAKTDITLDDMTKGADESTDSNLHKSMYDKWKTDWSSRFDGENTKFILCGTMWNPEDILNMIYQEGESYCGGIVKGALPYTFETVDGTRAYIKVPLLDENNKSTCEAVYSTKQALFLRDTTDEYLFKSVYQQDPIAPSGLEFAWDNLDTYVKLPETVSNVGYAVLDPTRRGRDNLSLPIFKQDLNDENLFDTWYMIDTYYKKIAMTEAYDDIVELCIKHNVRHLFIENNTDTSLRVVFEMKFKDLGYNIDLHEKYQTINKEKRIKDARGQIARQIKFKDRALVGKTGMYFDFMSALTRYSFDYPNKHDDAPDSLALMVSEVMNGGMSVKEIVVKNRSEYGI